MSAIPVTRGIFLLKIRWAYNIYWGRLISSSSRHIIIIALTVHKLNFKGGFWWEGTCSHGEVHNILETLSLKRSKRKFMPYSSDRLAYRSRTDKDFFSPLF